MRNNDQTPPLDSVHRALQLILALRAGRSLAVKDAAGLLEVAPSTAYRLLAALCYDGFASQERDRRYRAGPELVGEHKGTYSPDQLRTLLRPAIEDLNRTVNETIHVWVLNGQRVSYIDGVEGVQPLSVRTGVGAWNLVPAYSSAGGRALLAELGPAELDSIHADGLIPWRLGRITTMQSLKRRLVAVRKYGYSVNQEESVQGVSGIGACVKAPSGHPVAAISVAIPSIRFSREKVPEYAEALQAAVNLAERDIANSPGMLTDAQ